MSFYINGKKVQPPIEWRGMAVAAEWINGSIQPKIIGESFTFAGEAADIIAQHINSGNGSGGGIFEALEFKIQADDVVDGTVVAFDGILDFLQEYNVVKPNHISTAITRPEDIERVDNLLKSISYGYLYDKGLIGKGDYRHIPYIVQKLDRGSDILMMSLTAAFLTKSTIDAIKELRQAIVKISQANGILILILAIAYVAAVTVAILKFLREFIELCYPIPRTIKAMTLRTMLNKAFNHIGYQFESNIAELDQICYIPSRTYLDRRRLHGIPNIQDHGYRCSELVNLVLDLFNGQLQIDGNKAYIYSENDRFWVRNSKYVLPDVLLDSHTYNIDEAYATQIFSFSTDISDEWTIEDFEGTNYQVDLASTKQLPQRLNLLRGYRELRWPVALTSRKGVLDEFDLIAEKVLGGAIKDLYSGQLAKLQKKLGGKGIAGLNAIFNFGIGLMRVGNRYWSMPKLAFVNDTNAIPRSHRNTLGAKALYNKYHSFRSFAYPYTGQKKIYKNIRIPFGLKDWIALQGNNYFQTASGLLGRFERVEWRFGYDEATVDFYLYEPYIKNLKETGFEG